MKYAKMVFNLLWLLPFNILFGVLPLCFLWWQVKFQGVTDVGGLRFTPKANSWLAKYMSTHNWAGFNWCMFQLVYSTYSTSLLAHEDEHLRQQVRYNVLFYVLYALDLVYNLVAMSITQRKLNSAVYLAAYEEVLFEKLARLKEFK